MLLIGHRFIPSSRLYHIHDADGIKHTPANSTVLIEFSESNLDTIEHCRDNDVRFALQCRSLSEVIYANALNAAFIIVDEELAKSAQKAADHYLFDAKILARIHEENMLESMAESGVDGVIYPEGVVKVTG